MGIGAAAGVTAAVGLLLGRKAATIGKVGKGHPLKHRALDLRPARCSRSTRSTR